MAEAIRVSTRQGLVLRIFLFLSDEPMPLAVNNLWTVGQWFMEDADGTEGEAAEGFFISSPCNSFNGCPTSDAHASYSR